MPRNVFSPIDAGMYKNFPFKGNNSISLSLSITILGKVLSIIKLVNGDITHYLIKLSKDMDL